MSTERYDYGVGTAASPPVLLEPTIERAQERLERLQKRHTQEKFVIWRRPRPDWEIIPDLGSHNNTQEG